MSETKQPPDDLLGQTIADRYRIISRLGAGGMGVAYRAWDEEEGRPVVIKIPKRVFLEDPKFAERFAREIRLLQGLRHPHIVPIVDVGEHDGLPYVVMRFLPGGSLSNRRLRDEAGKVRPNPPGMLHLWLPDVADALDHVHANGVVHRDVKPANIFFDAYWNAFLGDFGIAKIVEETDSFDREHTLTATNMGIGTQEYMGPEQFTPKPVLDGRTDQYALAVMAYEMVSGTRPFTGTTAHLIVEVTTQPVPRLDRAVRGLPASLVEAVHRGLAKVPGERFGTCREFAYHLLRDVPLLADEPDIARLLCPKCSNILKLPVAAAGQKGKCPKCQTHMKVADDLGALWLLDEARRQRRAAASVVDVEEVDLDPDSVGAVPEIDEEALEAFKPVSSTTAIEKAAWRQAKKASPRMIFGGVAAVVVALVGLWMAFSGGEKPAAKPTYEQQLAQAEERVGRNPDDKTSNNLLGRHWCFRNEDWKKGLPYLARSGAIGLSSTAQKELDLEAANPPAGPGDRVRLAKDWWTLAGQKAFVAAEEATAIKKHAAGLYTASVAWLTDSKDVEGTKRWLDRDREFRELVGNKSPPRVHPNALRDKTLVVWVRLHNLEQRAGSALTIENTRNEFDGIVFGETSPGRWYVGSDCAHRSPRNPHDLPLEKEADKQPICVAVVYQNAQVTCFRNGHRYAEHTISNPMTFTRTESRVLFGLRHTSAADRSCLAADIDDARIYDCALSADQIAQLTPNAVSEIRPIAWWHFNTPEAKDEFGCFPSSRFHNCWARDGHLILSGKDSYLLCDSSGDPASSQVEERAERPVAQPSPPSLQRPESDKAGPPSDAMVWEKNGHAYKVFKEKLLWPQAKQRCEELGGHLVSITSQEEQEFVHTVIEKSGITVDTRQGLDSWREKLWAGGTDEGSEGKWRWVDGSAWGFTPWVKGQPDGDGNFLNICPHMRGGWNDDHAVGALVTGFICEWPKRAPNSDPVAPPQPASKQVSVWVADLPVKSRKSHFFHARMSWESIGGKRYANTIHIHPEVGSGQSQLVFEIDGKYEELTGAIGVLDMAKRIASPQIFRIVGDGKELWESAPFQQTGKGEDFRVNVSGVKTLELHADSTGPRFDAHCVWIEPRLVKLPVSQSSKPKVATAEEILARPPITNSIGIKLKLIPPGTFMMGSEDGEADEKPVHEVRLTMPFYLGVTEVMNAQWQAVMAGEPPSRWKDGDRPVEMVSWKDAIDFCRKLSERPEERAAGRVYRLPTEAEWEYACRAGTTTKWASGDDEKTLGDMAWFKTNIGSQTRPVGGKLSNAWGLHDMHGNVWEWCSDLYGAYADGGTVDPTGPAGGSHRVARGGSWNFTAGGCRSADRGRDDPLVRSHALGFRLALSPSESTPPEAGRNLWQTTSQGAPKVFRRESTTGWTELQPKGVSYRFTQTAETPDYVELKCAAGRNLRIRLQANGSDLQQNGGGWGHWYAGKWSTKPELPEWARPQGQKVDTPEKDAVGQEVPPDPIVGR